jgi:protein-tyrosine phosphatase
MYDIHCHILPDLDDGPKDLEASLEMARLATADGTRTIIATPHGARVAALGGRAALEKHVHSFFQAMLSQEVPLKLVMGVEYLLTLDLVREAQQGSVITLNGSQYILVEIDFQQWPPYTDEALFQVQLAGYTPILAHPERQATIQQSPTLLEGLVERGVLAEVTGGSLLGDFGDTAQRSAEELVRRGLVHFIASDGHSPTRNRPPVMAAARAALARLAGEETAHLLAVANPLAVVQGGPVTVPGPVQPTKARGVRWFGRR